MQPGEGVTAVSSVAASRKPTVEQIWQWLAEVADPEIPVISVVDLGIVRDVHWERGVTEDRLVVTVTPTYSGCPATSTILSDIKTALEARGLAAVRIETRLSPPWTTDWISEVGRQKLRGFGIAPPAQAAGGAFPLRPYVPAAVRVECPRCGSANTSRVSEFGSTPCKAQYRCEDCLEPFDYFKCI